jgi:hypothetical protein
MGTGSSFTGGKATDEFGSGYVPVGVVVNMVFELQVS